MADVTQRQRKRNDHEMVIDHKPREPVVCGTHGTPVITPLTSVLHRFWSNRLLRRTKQTSKNVFCGPFIIIEEAYITCYQKRATVIFTMPGRTSQPH